MIVSYINVILFIPMVKEPTIPVFKAFLSHPNFTVPFCCLFSLTAVPTCYSSSSSCSSVPPAKNAQEHCLSRGVESAVSLKDIF